MHITKLERGETKVTNNWLQIVKHEHWNKEWKNFKKGCSLKVFKVCVCLKPYILLSVIWIRFSHVESFLRAGMGRVIISMCLV